jgi:hypothetical protein
MLFGTDADEHLPVARSDERNGVVSASTACCCLPILASRKTPSSSASAAMIPYFNAVVAILTKWPAPLGLQCR